MRTLQFTVNDQILSKTGDFSHIIRGTSGYLKCKFTFEGTEWNGCKVAAVFENNGEEFAVPVHNKTCMVPNEVTDFKYFKVRLVGADTNNKRIVTNKVLVEQEG